MISCVLRVRAQSSQPTGLAAKIKIRVRKRRHEFHVFGQYNHSDRGCVKAPRGVCPCEPSTGERHETRPQQTSVASQPRESRLRHERTHSTRLRGGLRSRPSVQSWWVLGSWWKGILRALRPCFLRIAAGLPQALADRERDGEPKKD